MRQVKYQGGFEHPVRAFLIGASLLVLLFGGFVVGVEAGTHPMDPTAASTRVVTRTAARTVIVPTPVVRTVIRGITRVVQLPGATRTRMVVIHDHGKTVFAYETPPAGSTISGSPATASPPTVYTVPAETVTEPPVTVTEPPVTVTVTDTSGGGSGTQPTTDTTGP